MRAWIMAFTLAILVCNLTACGYRGKLRSPAQIEAEEQKKARKEAKAKEQEEEKPQDAPAEPPPAEEPK